MKPRKFEIPYVPCNEEVNKQFIDFYSNRFDKVESVYAASYINDGLNTRAESKNFVTDFDEYIYLMSQIKEHFPIEILFQKNSTKELIEKYYKLGYKRFTINNDELAKQIKKEYKDIILTLSITRLLQHNDLFDLDLSYYDYIVLDYRYCRQISLLKELPKKYQYVLLVNSSCNYNNRSFCQLHWFNGETRCFKNKEKSSFIRPVDLVYFDDYIHHYKLQGREFFPNFIHRSITPYMRKKENYYDLE